MCFFLFVSLFLFVFLVFFFFFFFQAEDGIRDAQESRGLGDVYKRQGKSTLLESIASREVPIPEFIDIWHLHEEAQPEEKSAVDCVIDHVKKEEARLNVLSEQILEEDPESPALEDIYELSLIHI
eukprot:TRINITY_DN14134_c0_g1_i3.p1 TRINITY_DN14134_c0_g1~~TRINITY_DN14134_c0_g1_i3.p1  ORF type:complete len:125 (-),score=47.77 TRINITY_DN14134_c0_g1_i3:175-549(-)